MPCKLLLLRGASLFSTFKTFNFSFYNENTPDNFDSENGRSGSFGSRFVRASPKSPEFGYKDETGNIDIRIGAGQV